MEMAFSGKSRSALLKVMQNETFDVLVVGGGITGAGIALDAQTRGMRTALIEMQDFAAGTSSRSTKLVHGGLRYLKQFEVKMVAEVGKERAIVYHNGPHVTTPEWMLLPIYEGGSFGMLSTSIGLKLYDYLAGVVKKERRLMLSREETLNHEPLLKRDGLKGGGYYVEYRTDDARLTMEVMKKAAEHGAAAVNYTKVESFIYEAARLAGVKAVDRVSGCEYTIRARTVVNATGPWVDSLRELDHSKRGKTLRLTKGVHLVFDSGRFPLRQAVYFDTTDGRMVFAIPRDGKTYVGTTDTDYKGDTANPTMSVEDRKYLLAAINFMFPQLELTEADVESSWAGLRPLIYQEGKSPSEVSRRDEIFESPSGLITIAGGKLTGYRKMGEHIVDLLAKKLTEQGLGPFGESRTRTMPISGGDVGGPEGFLAYVDGMTKKGVDCGLPHDAASKLARRYGSNAACVFELAAAGTEDAQRLRLPLELYAELAYAIGYEMAVTPADFLIRRTGAMFFDIGWARRGKDDVIKAMADILGYTDDQLRQYKAELNFQLQHAVCPV